MGGFWGIGTAIFLVLAAGMMVVYRRRAGIIASLAGVAMLGFVGLLPQSNELRYFMFIPLTWAGTIGMLFKPIQIRFPRAAVAILALVVVLFGYIVSETWQYYQVTALDNRAAAKVWGADKFWPLRKAGETYCAVHMYPLGILLTGPTLSEFSIVDRSEASLCPPGTIIITKQGIRDPPGDIRSGDVTLPSRRWHLDRHAVRTRRARSGSAWPRHALARGSGLRGGSGRQQTRPMAPRHRRTRGARIGRIHEGPDVPPARLCRSAWRDRRHGRLGRHHDW
jgi:hypothetical protein